MKRWCRWFGHDWCPVIEFRPFGSDERIRCSRCGFTVEQSGSWD